MITDPKPMHEAVSLHASETLRGHRHAHGQDRGHDHGHNHHHHRDTAQQPASVLPRRSLLALSGGMRLLLVLPLIALLWALTFWAVNGG